MATGVGQEPDEPQAPAICHHMRTILDHLKTNQVVIVSAPPGSGNSSVLPRLLANTGYGPVVCAQPRQFAATVASAKAGHGKEPEPGVTFTTTRHLIDVLCGAGPAAFLAAFRTVVVDEAHDRTLCTDVLLAMVRSAVATDQFGHLKVVVCTAGGGTADGLLGDFFGGAPVVAFRRAVAHPVEVRYSRGPVLDMVGAVVEEVAGIHRSKPPGDVLVFLPDVARVEDAYGELERLGLPGMAVCAAHDHLPAELTSSVLEPAPGGARKVVLATDVAETAVLVPGIAYVVDTGVVSEDPLERVSKEAVNRRAEAAGAGCRPGHCHRLYMEDEYAGFDEHAVPHVRRDGALLKLAFMLKRHAAEDMPGFELLDQAVAPALENAVGELVASGYLDKHGKLTQKGEQEAYDED